MERAYLALLLKSSRFVVGIVYECFSSPIVTMIFGPSLCYVKIAHPVANAHTRRRIYGRSCRTRGDPRTRGGSGNSSGLSYLQLLLFFVGLIDGERESMRGRVCLCVQRKVDGGRGW